MKNGKFAFVGELKTELTVKLILMYSGYLNTLSIDCLSYDLEPKARLYQNYLLARALLGREPTTEVRRMKFNRSPNNYEQSTGVTLYQVPRGDHMKMVDLDLVFICPFRYDEISFKRSIILAQQFKKKNSTTKFVFLPCKTPETDAIIIQEVDKVLLGFGNITPFLDYNLLSQQKIDCLEIPQIAKENFSGIGSILLQNIN